MTLSLMDPTPPPEVAQKIRASERTLKRQQAREAKMAHSARMAWRRSVEENLVKGLRQSMQELWETTDLEVRLMAGHLATVAVHTVIPDMEQVEAKTQEAIAAHQKPRLLDANGDPL